MRITFVLPSAMRIPMGGAAVVYRYAGGLATRGHHVTVVGQRQLAGGIRGRLQAVAVSARDIWQGVSDAPYYAADNVATLVVDTLEPDLVPDADVVIATGWQTAKGVAALPAAKGRKFYFIQGLESYQSPEALETWALPMTRLTCAHWLAEQVRAQGHEVAGTIPNAIDKNEFWIEKPVEGRGLHMVALYHRASIKGPLELIDALKALRRRFPALHATVFSARPPSHRLPGWVDIRVRPTVDELRKMFNSAAVLLHTSTLEGWPLVPMEAAACGCAVAGFANQGVREYLADGETAALVVPGDVPGLVRRTAALLVDSAGRTELATAAHAAVARYSWQDSTDQLETLLS